MSTRSATFEPEGSPSLASIDLGSNTVRLLVGRAEGGRISRRLVRQETTRLGQGLIPGARFRPEALARTWRVLEAFRDETAARGAERVLLGATMAVREAADGPDLLARVERELNFKTVMLTGDQEAALTAAGVLTVLDPVPERAVIFDLGGRSTEFVLVEKGCRARVKSLSLGAVALTEAHLTGDPPGPGEIDSCRRAAALTLAQDLIDFKERVARPFSLVGTAGTTTTLAAMDQALAVYRPELIDNYRLSRDGLAGLFERLAGMSVLERSRMPGLPADRADVIAGGAAAVLEIMDFFNMNELIVSDAGLLEGLWLAAAGREEIGHDE
ncbi:MAG: Ppx/GppA family phosphatase [Proteobacteria bacterium]|nr:Ppx/GppA family phosphatase [Pseudomonadota bacterium]